MQDTSPALRESGFEQDAFFERDLSWLKFNKRVLMEAQNEAVPLYERLKFTAIYSSNMDEFFRVRFATMRRVAELAKTGKKKIKKLTGFHAPGKLVRQVLAMTQEQQEAYGRNYRESIIPALAREGVILYTTSDFAPEHLDFIEEYFYTQMLSFLQPLIIDESSRNEEVFLQNRMLYHAVDLVDSEGKRALGVVNIPSPPLGRFVELPSLNGKFYYAFQDDIVRFFIHILFPGYKVIGVHAIKLNRDAELYLDHEFSGDLIEKLKKNLGKRAVGNPSRFLYDSVMPFYLVRELQEQLGLAENDLVPGGRYHNMFDHFGLPNPIGDKLTYPKAKPLSHPVLSQYPSVLEAIEKEDILLHFPYQRYDYILRYFNEAIISRKVKEIKVTIYRVAENSHVVNALISAARNGKKVTVFVEAKARFDEENNLKWANRMQEVGIDVRFSDVNLKVHSKVALLIGENSQGEPVKYAFFGTGNFNEKTAAIYADHALLTSNKELTDELDQTFEFIFGNRENLELDHLLVAQVNMVEHFLQKIDREIEHVKAGKEGRMIIKLNNLQERGIIEKLYEAADAGVDITVIVRAICCAKPRKNLRLIRIVDKYLEHARVYWFHNAGQKEIYMGSADWMERNLYRRIEVVFPIYSETLREEVCTCVEIQMKDNTKACTIETDMSNKMITGGDKPVRAQNDFYEWLSGRGDQIIS